MSVQRNVSVSFWVSWMGSKQPGLVDLELVARVDHHEDQRGHGEEPERGGEGGPPTGEQQRQRLGSHQPRHQQEREQQHLFHDRFPRGSARRPGPLREQGEHPPDNDDEQGHDPGEHKGWQLTDDLGGHELRHQDES